MTRWETIYGGDDWQSRPPGGAGIFGPTCGILLETGSPDYILLEDATSPSDVILLEDC